MISLNLTNSLNSSPLRDNSYMYCVDSKSFSLRTLPSTKESYSLRHWVKNITSEFVPHCLQALNFL